MTSEAAERLRDELNRRRAPDRYAVGCTEQALTLEEREPVSPFYVFREHRA